MFFKKKQPWHACVPSYMPRKDQIAWFKAVEEIAILTGDKLPRTSCGLKLPGQNTYMCLSKGCEEPTYEIFCNLCITDSECWNVSLIIDEDKDTLY